MRFYSAGKPWGDVLPRYAFLEQVFLQRKVLEIGCADGIGAFFLKDRGAVEVAGVDLEGPALQEAQQRRAVPGVSFGAFDGLRLDFPAESFDVVVDFELGLVLEPARLDEILRVLKYDGCLVTAVSNPRHPPMARLAGAADPREALSYEEFISILQERFPRLTVVGQTPFIGFSVGWLGAEAEDLPLEMDSVLAPEEAEEVAYYVVVCGRHSLNFESQSLIQLPYRAIIQEVGQHPDAAARDECPEVEPVDLERLLEELEQQRRIAGEKEAALQEAREQVRHLQADSRKLSDDGEDLRQRLAILESEAELNRKRAEEFQRLAGHREAEVAEKLSWLEASQSEVERLQRRIEEALGEITSLKSRIRELEQEALRSSRIRPESEVLIGSLREESGRLKVALRRTNEDLSRIRREKESLEQERLCLEAEQARLQAVMGEHRRESAEVWEKCCQLEIHGAETKQSLAALQAELAQSQALVDELQEHRLEADAEKQALGQHLAEVRRREQSLRAERETISAELSAQREELAQLRRRLTEEAGRAASVQAHLAEQEERNRELEADLVAMVNRQEEGQAQDRDRQQLVAELQRRLERQHQALQDAGEKIDDLTRQLFSARRGEEDLARAHQESQKKLKDQELAREALELEISNLRLELQERLHRSQGDLLRAEHRLAAARRDLSERGEDLQRAEEAQARLRQEESQRCKEMDRLQGRLEELQHRLEQAGADRERIKLVEQELAWRREEVERLTAELQSRGEELEEARWELERLHEALDQTRVEFERASRESAEALAAREVLKQQTDRLAAKNRELEIEMTRLAEREGRLDSMSQELEEARGGLERERAHSQLLSREVDRLRGELHPVREEYRLVLEREHTMQSRVATLQQQLGELEEKTSLEISSLSGQVRRREEQMLAITNNLAEMEARARSAEERADRLEEQLRQERELAAAERTEQVGRLAASVEEQRRRALDMESEMNRVWEQAVQSERQWKQRELALRVELEAATAELDRLKQQS